MDEFQIIDTEDFRKIISIVRTVKGIDFSYFTTEILMHRIARSMNLHGVATVDRLIAKLTNDVYFADIFVFDIFVPTTEFFRDFSMWKFLDDNIIEKLKNETLLKIWIPQICGDEELFSLLILLNRKNILNRCSIYATSPSQKILKDTKSGIVDIKKLEISRSNFAKLAPNAQIDDYLTKIDKYDYFSSDLLDNVIFLKSDIVTDPPPDNGFNLVIFRDRMLYMNVQTKKMVVENISKTIVNRGYFVIGIRENINPSDFNNVLVPLSKSEKIFVKVQK